MSDLVAATKSTIVIMLVTASLFGCNQDGFSLTDAPTEQVISGVLVSGRPSGADCAWIQESSGRRIEVFWPDRWRVEFDPLAVFDETGERNIRAGERATLEGYLAEAGGSVCPSDGLFNAVRVLSVEPVE